MIVQTTSTNEVLTSTHEVLTKGMNVLPVSRQEILFMDRKSCLWTGNPACKPCHRVDIKPRQVADMEFCQSAGRKVLLRSRHGSHANEQACKGPANEQTRKSSSWISTKVLPLSRHEILVSEQTWKFCQLAGNFCDLCRSQSWPLLTKEIL